MFDPQSFLDAEILEGNSTSSIPVPIGEYPGSIKSVDVKGGVSNKPGSEGTPWSRLEVTWNIDDENVKALLERREVTCRQQIMLDLTEAGGLDMGKGKNVRLGRLRDALGLNQPGKPFSFRMMTGLQAKVVVKQEEYQGSVMGYVDSVVKLA